MRLLVLLLSISVSASLLAAVSNSSSEHLGQRTTGSIEGTVKDAQGAVISQASIVVKKKDSNAEVSTTSNDEGYFKVSNLDPGKYTLTVSASGFASTEAEVEVNIAQSRVHEIVLGEPVNGKIKGLVRDQSGHQPLAKAKITIKRSDDGTSSDTETDNQGNYEKPGLAPGNYSVEANAAGYRPQVKRVSLGPRQVKGVNFDLQKR